MKKPSSETAPGASAQHNSRTRNSLEIPQFFRGKISQTPENQG